MGTRALVTVENENQNILTLYNHWDGYPSGLGAQIKERFGATEIINGISLNQWSERRRAWERPEAPAFANGIGCFAAQLVAHLKDGIGDVSLMAAETREIGEGYIYDLFEEDGRIFIRLYERRMRRTDRLIYEGPLSQMPLEFNNENEEGEAA